MTSDFHGAVSRLHATFFLSTLMVIFTRPRDSIAITQEPKDTVVAIEPRLRRLVTEPDWLKEKHGRPIRDKSYAQYLLYRPADHVSLLKTS